MTTSIPIEQARAAKSKALAVFTKLATVNGVGLTRIGEGYGLKINLAKQPTGGKEMPDHVDGVPVTVEIVGEISKR